MTPDYAVAGGITFDWVAAPTGETSRKACGGNALYAAVGAYFWSDHVAVVSRVGWDYPAEYLSAFEQAGIDMTAVRRLDEPHGLGFAARYNGSGDRHEYDVQQVADRWGRPDFDPEAYPCSGLERPIVEIGERFYPVPSDIDARRWPARGFHVAPMVHRSERAFVKTLAQHSTPFTLDPGHNATPSQFRELLAQVRVFLPSKRDTVRLLGQAAEDGPLERLAAMGPDIVVIKLGREGSVVFEARRGRQRRVPAYPTFAKDPTGAGDAYCGGFLVGLLETGDAFEAALWATVSASFVIEEFDARYGLRFRRRDAEARLVKLRTLAP